MAIGTFLGDTKRFTLPFLFPVGTHIRVKSLRHGACALIHFVRVRHYGYAESGHDIFVEDGVMT